MSRQGFREAAISAGAGLHAAAALGCVNFAAHQADAGLRIMFAAFGLYSVAGAARLAARRKDVKAEAGLASSTLIVLFSLLPLAARPGGSVLWAGGAWVAAAGALLGLVAVLALGGCFAVAPALRGVVSKGPYAAVRHPMALGFLIVAVGYLSIHASPWNASVLGLSVLVALGTAFAEERLLLQDADYRAYATRVRWRFLPGLL